MSDAHIRFLFSKETIKKRLKWKDIKMLRKARLQAKEDYDIENLQIVACRFMADENNQYLPFDKAFAIFDELSQEESQDAIEKFTAAFQESTIPPTSGEPSPSTLQVSSPIPTTSPDGSVS